MSAAERARRARFRSFMSAYYSARAADLAALESATAMYATEVAEYISTVGRPMHFKTWLILSAGMPR